MEGTKETGEGKNSIGNGETKELICMTQGHELRVEGCWWKVGARLRGIKGRQQMGPL